MQILSTCISLESLWNTLEKTTFVTAMFTLTVFEILLLKSRSVLGFAQKGTGNEAVNFNNIIEKIFLTIPLGRLVFESSTLSYL